MKKTKTTLILLILASMLTSCGDRNEYAENCNCQCEVTMEPEIEMAEMAESDIETVTELDSETETEFEIIDYYNSPEKEEKIYAKVKNKYLNLDWDGTPIKMGKHTVSIAAQEGSILVDGYLAGSQECVDLIGVDKDEFESYCYIPGKGTYVITKKKEFTKYLKGQQIELSGGTLQRKNEKGNDEWLLHYDEFSDKLFLVIDEMDTYENKLYEFPDYNKSKIKYIGETLSIFKSDNGFLYSDPDGIFWRYDRKSKKFLKAKEMNS